MKIKYTTTMRFLKISLLLFFVSSFSQTKTHELIDSKLECHTVITRRVNQRIISSNIEKDTLFIKIQYIENCNNGDILNYSIKKDTISFNFDFSSKEIADCDCVFTNNLKIKKPKIKKPVFKINNTHGIKELKISDNYYLPAEYIIKNNDTLMIFDDNGHEFSRSFYESGKIHSLSINKNSYNERIVYYENGKTKSIRQSLPDFDHYILREWDENGKLTKFESTIEIGDITPTHEQQSNGALLIISKEKKVKEN